METRAPRMSGRGAEGGGGRDQQGTAGSAKTLIKTALALLGSGATVAVAIAMAGLQVGTSGVPPNLWDRAPFLVVAVVGMLLLAGVGKYFADQSAAAIREAGETTASAIRDDRQAGQAHMESALQRSIDQHQATQKAVADGHDGTQAALRELASTVNSLVKEMGKREKLADDVRKLVQDEMQRRNGG